MKRLPTTLAIGFLFAAIPATAALPPKYQRLAELKAILESSEVQALLPDDQQVDRIEYVRPDLYRVSAGTCFLPVAIVKRPAPAGMVGPRHFDVIPGELDCPAEATE
ncbi:hypothetical protein [Sphingopyxis indica]|uniref:Uncharacterized protein n=1 Tax=Sphingopyxis indica TaxID=436663 RepID=A0A239FF70_9SPHN|nr:hypothetical protein [Sphingopyxis indica]SNS54724.1 hypothetical protein SAMN06295955_10222 [Sphingopyxis indica]